MDEERESFTISYIYDENKILIGFYLVEGDIVDKYGYDYGNYIHDPWGNLVGQNIFSNNPIRYKGYYYDEETGIYYLKSRYYDSSIGRFISPDSVDYLDPESINGLNLYAYCGSDPVNLCDPSGHLAISAIIIGAVIGIVTTGIKDYVNDRKIFNGDISGWEYFGSALGGTIGGVGTKLGTTVLASGIGNVVEALFAGDISSFVDIMVQFTLGSTLGGVGYGVSKGITSIFADKKIYGVLGNLTDNTKVN